jgi:hypothetical protein
MKTTAGATFSTARVIASWVLSLIPCGSGEGGWEDGVAIGELGWIKGDGLEAVTLGVLGEEGEK